MTKRKSKGAYMISAVAEMYGIHPQTLASVRTRGVAETVAHRGQHPSLHGRGFGSDWISS